MPDQHLREVGSGLDVTGEQVDERIALRQCQRTKVPAVPNCAAQTLAR